MATTYELAEKYYPRLWDDKRLESLVEAGKLTKEEIKKIKENQAEKA